MKVRITLHQFTVKVLFIYNYFTMKVYITLHQFTMRVCFTYNLLTIITHDQFTVREQGNVLCYIGYSIYIGKNAG